MKIKIPKKWTSKTLKTVLDGLATQLFGEENEYVVFEDKLGISTSRQQLLMGAREFRRFARDIKVEGGTKSLEKNWLFIRPHCSKRIPVRLPPEMYQLLKQLARERKITPTEIIRNLIGNLILQWQEKKREKEKENPGYA